MNVGDASGKRGGRFNKNECAGLLLKRPTRKGVGPQSENSQFKDKFALRLPFRRTERFELACEPLHVGIVGIVASA